MRRFQRALSREKGWAKNRVRIPTRVIADTGITDWDKTLYMHYARYPKGCWRSDEQLANDVGCNARGISQSRLRLERADHIVVKHRGRERTCLVRVRPDRGHFVMVPLALLSMNIPYAMRTLLAAIAYAQGNKVATWASFAALAREAGISARHARRLKREMYRLGLIKGPDAHVINCVINKEDSRWYSRWPWSLITLSEFTSPRTTPVPSAQARIPDPAPERKVA